VNLAASSPTIALRHAGSSTRKFYGPKTLTGALVRPLILWTQSWPPPACIVDEANAVRRDCPTDPKIANRIRSLHGLSSANYTSYAEHRELSMLVFAGLLLARISKPQPPEAASAAVTPSNQVCRQCRTANGSQRPRPAPNMKATQPCSARTARHDPFIAQPDPSTPNYRCPPRRQRQNHIRTITARTTCRHRHSVGYVMPA